MSERFQTFTVLISKINKNIKKIKNQEMAEYGLKNAHVSCIYFLYCAESLTATELCELCEEDKGTISRSLDFLQENGYVFYDNVYKRYRSHVSLTQKGLEIGRKIANKIDFVLDEICNDLTKEQRADFYRSLAIVSDNLELCAKGLQKAKRIKDKIRTANL